MKVFLGGTCNESKWRDELIKLLKIDYFNPVVDDWTSECQEEERKQREICDFCLYVITPRMKGIYSIAEVVDDSNKRPEKTIFCLLDTDKADDGDYITWSKAEYLSLTQVKYMVQDNGGKVFTSLESVADYLNGKSNTLVISGFPGVGKSYLFKTQTELGKTVLDSDSSQFSWIEKDVRHPDFPNNYINHIKENLGKVDIIMVSSHKVVRDALRQAGIDYTLVYPDRECKSSYIQRYVGRGNDINFITMMMDKWDDFLDEIEEETYPKKIALLGNQTLADVVK